jgi:hypothetical protein
MAITAGICNSYKAEILAGNHTSAHTYKIALYTSNATLSEATTAFSVSGNEVVGGGGYTTGGATLSGFNINIDTSVAILDFADVTYSTATFSARGALIYNASVSNKAVCVLDFGADIAASNGAFTITFPSSAAATGLIRIA